MKTYQHDNATFSPYLTEGENQLMQAFSRYGSDAYPVRRIKSRWMVEDAYGVTLSPVVYRTKRAAVAQVEAWIDAMLAKMTAGLLDRRTP